MTIDILEIILLVLTIFTEGYMIYQ